MKKQILVYGAGAVLTITGLSMLQKVDISKVDLLYYLALLITSILGCIHIRMMNRIFFSQPSRVFGLRFRVTILIMIVSFLISATLYRLSNLEIRFLTFIISFIVPYIIYQAYLIFTQMLARKQAIRD